MSTASCVVRDYYHGSTHVQIDNCPGNGAQSWAWIWTGSDNQFATVYLNVYDRYPFWVTAQRNSAASKNLPADINTVQICNYPTISQEKCGRINFI
ncbi:hypothetical protein AB0F46_42920 [Streptomyces sp. NPDC026665]|uniref:hypothetical protein n=1 Tax=Streptomyces sp. NPDC026665 TaxID=3154798 RepID=UPI0033C3F022